MEKEIIQAAINNSAEYVKHVGLIEERPLMKIAYQDGYIEGVKSGYINWDNPKENKPLENKKLLFKLKDGDIRMGFFHNKDQFDRINMFCDGSFHHIDNVESYFYIIS